MLCINLYGIYLKVRMENGIIVKMEFTDSCRKTNKELENAIIDLWKNGKDTIKYVFDVNSDLALIYRKAMKIPFGKVVSYGKLSESIFGTKKYARFIGYAMKKNPLPIIVPCHRIVKADRTLGGFGGGVKTKEKLLSLEGINIKNGKIPESYFIDI